MGFSKKLAGINFIKIQGLKEEFQSHYFELNGQKIEETNFNGRLINIEPSEYKYNDIPRETIKMLFVDNNNDYYQLDISYNILSRGAINSILGYIDKQKKKGYNEGILNIELFIYISKDNYKKLGIRINGEKPEWRYSIEEQKKLIKTRVNENGVEERDFSKYDELLKNSLSEIQKFIGGKQQEIPSNKNKKLNNKEEITIEDVPF